jgi:hypothetical protein
MLAGNKPRVATLLSLDIASAFDRISHTRLTQSQEKKNTRKAGTMGREFPH